MRLGRAGLDDRALQLGRLVLADDSLSRESVHGSAADVQVAAVGDQITRIVVNPGWAPRAGARLVGQRLAERLRAVQLEARDAAGGATEPATVEFAAEIADILREW